MWTKHISEQLAAYVDGQLPPAQALRAELHMRDCEECRAACEQVREGMAGLDVLPQVQAPEAIWTAIEAAWQAAPPPRSLAIRPCTGPYPLRNVAQTLVSALSTLVSRRLRWASATVVVLVLAGAAWWRWAARTGGWEVVRLAGTPTVDTKPIAGKARAGAGEWVETDRASSATIQVGAIGSVAVSPGTRLRIVTAQTGEHRIALSHGEIRANITAPPRLFFVDTASGTAVDLGCEYTLSSDDEGSGALHVSRGWVSYQWKGLESLVPAGASCRTRPVAGPGIPYFDDARDGFRLAVENWGLEKDANGALDLILAEARVRDTLTLWHLLPRVNSSDRARVYDAIAALTPVPKGVSREKALQLDPPTLKHWLEELAWTW